MFALGDLSLFRALQVGPAAIVTPLSTMYPVVTLMYAVPFMRERMALMQWLAVAILLAGIVAVSLG